MTVVQISKIPPKKFAMMSSKEGGCFANCLHAVLTIKTGEDGGRFSYAYGKVKAKDGVWTEHAYLMAKNGQSTHYFDPTLQPRASLGPFTYDKPEIADYEVVRKLFDSLNTAYREKVERGEIPLPLLKFLRGQWQFVIP